MIILSMHLLPRVNDMLDFICMGPDDLPRVRQKRQKKQKQNEDFFPTVWFSNPRPWDFCQLSIVRISNAD